MARKNFISKEFFVNATEQQTQDTLFEIPQFVGNIKLVNKHTPAHTIKFLYEREGGDLQYHVDVSLLPLDQQCTSVCLHITYANGQVFTKDSNIIHSLNNFESAIQSALNGSLDSYQPLPQKQNKVAQFAHATMMLAASVSMLFISRKLS
jgi:alkyl hydroperoxide reductase subunit AhpF